MHLHPSLNLDPAQVRQRERAARFIETIRHDLDTLMHYIEHASADALRGNYWTEKVQDAELAAKAAVKATTCEGQARIGWGEARG